MKTLFKQYYEKPKEKDRTQSYLLFRAIMYKTLGNLAHEALDVRSYGTFVHDVDKLRAICKTFGNLDDADLVFISKDFPNTKEVREHICSVLEKVEVGVIEELVRVMTFGDERYVDEEVALAAKEFNLI